MRDIFRKIKNRSFGYEMTFPSVALMLVLTVYPVIFTAIYSFTNYNFLKKEKAFIGFSNYTSLFQNEYFIQSLKNTAEFTILAVLLEVSIGVFLAVFVKSLKEKTQKILRVVLMFPYLLPSVTVALVFKMMLSPNFGIINQILEKIHIPVFNWFYDSRTAFLAILFIDVWQNVPFVFLLVYAKLTTLPSTQYEAAQIDGANWFQVFRFITLPNISGCLTVCIMLRMIDTFRLFEKVNILTGGGPAGTTSTVTQFMYNYGIQTFKFGFGSACSVTMTLLVLIFALFYIRRIFSSK